MNIHIISHDLQFVEQRHKLEIKALKEAESKKEMKLISLGIGVLLLLVIALLYYRVRYNKTRRFEAEQRQLYTLTLLEKEKEDKENLKQQISGLERERADLEELLNSEEYVDPNIKIVIQERTQKLNELLAGYIITNDDSESKYLKWVKSLIVDKDKFMNDTRIALTVSHPKLIKFLENSGLTVDEINYVGLYAIGLRGKEIGNYIHMRSHYNISLNIRKKLNLDGNKTNLGVYIRKLMEKM